VVDADGEIVDLSLPQPTTPEDDGPVAEAPTEAAETTPADETAEIEEEPKP
jgi:hypothetical protein